MLSWIFGNKTGGSKLEAQYHYIIIGARSSGCILANRLSEDADKTVLLLEAGSPESVDRKIQVPAASWDLQRSEVDWDFELHPQEKAGKAWKDLRCPRGKCLGGSSSINAMLYTRGDSTDYDNWEKLGAEGWSCNDVLPYFNKSENNKIADHKDSPYHNTGGLLPVNEPCIMHRSMLDIIKAGQELGYEEVDVSSGKDILGFGKFPATIDNGSRASASKAFLEPAMTRPNLTVVTGAHVCKIKLEDKRAVGVYFIVNETQKYVGAKREVILSAGAICSPQILMLSGIGPKSHLEEVEIECVQDLPVGQNLQDHYACVVKATISPINKDDVIVLDDVGLITMVKYLLGQKENVLGLNAVEATCFLRTGLDKETQYPDLQMHFVPCFSFGGLGERSLFAVKSPELEPLLGHDKSLKEQMQQAGVSLVPTLLHPRSIGSVTLRDDKPDSPPVINPNYLDDQYDVDVMVEGIRIVKKLIERVTLKEKGYNLVNLQMPGVTEDEFFYENLWEYMGHFGLSIYHPVGISLQNGIS